MADDDATPPGWYRQSDEPDLLRWWDGDDWTEDTMPVPDGAGTRAAKARAAKAAAARAEPVPAAEGTGSRRTRRDAMAEAEADVAGVRIARAIATGSSDGGLPPVEIVLEREPKGVQPDIALDAPTEPDAPSTSVFEPDHQAPDPAAAVAAKDGPAPRRRRPAPTPGEGPGYRRPAGETVRLLGETVDEDLWMAEAWDAAPSAPARHRPEPAARGARGPRIAAPGPRPGTRPGATAAGPPQRRGDRLVAAPSPATAATLLRVVVRAALIAAVVGVGWFAYSKIRDAQPSDADTLSKDPRGVVVDQDAPRLDQIVLTLADLPRGWTAQANDPQSDDICEGRIPRSVLEPTGILGATFTSDNGSLVSNVVQEFVDEDTAEAFMDLTARVIDSCRQYGSDGSTVRLTPLDFPRFGDETFAVEATGDSPSGTLHGAIVHVRHGYRVSSVLTLAAGENQVDTELVEHLTQLVDRRMGSKPVLDDDDLPGGTGGGELPGD